MWERPFFLYDEEGCVLRGEGLSALEEDEHSRHEGKKGAPRLWRVVREKFPWPSLASLRRDCRSATAAASLLLDFVNLRSSLLSSSFSPPYKDPQKYASMGSCGISGKWRTGGEAGGSNSILLVMGDWDEP